jgi:hypothetical protein
MFEGFHLFRERGITTNKNNQLQKTLGGTSLRYQRLFVVVLSCEGQKASIGKRGTLKKDPQKNDGVHIERD